MYYLRSDEEPLRIAGLHRAMRSLSDIMFYTANQTYLQVCVDDNKNIFVCYLYETDQDKLTQIYTIAQSFGGVYLHSDFIGHVNTHEKHIYYLFRPLKEQATYVYTMPISDTPYSYDQLVEMGEDALFKYVNECKLSSVMELLSGERPPDPVEGDVDDNY